MKRIKFTNNEEPGISQEILEQLQDNIEEGIEKQIKFQALYSNAEGATNGILEDNVDNFDLILVIIANKGFVAENQFLLFPVMKGALNAQWYIQSYNIRATSSYYSSGKVYLDQKTSFKVDMSAPVGWNQGDIRVYKIIGIRF